MISRLWRWLFEPPQTSTYHERHSLDTEKLARDFEAKGFVRDATTSADGPTAQVLRRVEKFSWKWFAAWLFFGFVGAPAYFVYFLCKRDAVVTIARDTVGVHWTHRPSKGRNATSAFLLVFLVLAASLSIYGTFNQDTDGQEPRAVASSRTSSPADEPTATEPSNPATAQQTIVLETPTVAVDVLPTISPVDLARSAAFYSLATPGVLGNLGDRILYRRDDSSMASIQTSAPCLGLNTGCLTSAAPATFDALVAADFLWIGDPAVGIPPLERLNILVCDGSGDSPCADANRVAYLTVNVDQSIGIQLNEDLLYEDNKWIFCQGIESAVNEIIWDKLENKGCLLRCLALVELPGFIGCKN